MPNHPVVPYTPQTTGALIESIYQNRNLSQNIQRAIATLKADPENFKLYVALGHGLKAQNRHPEALKVYKLAHRLNFRNEYIYENILSLSEKLGCQSDFFNYSSRYISYLNYLQRQIPEGNYYRQICGLIQHRVQLNVLYNNRRAYVKNLEYFCRYGEVNNQIFQKLMGVYLQREDYKKLHRSMAAIVTTEGPSGFQRLLALYGKLNLLLSLVLRFKDVALGKLLLQHLEQQELSEENAGNDSWLLAATIAIMVGNLTKFRCFLARMSSYEMMQDQELLCDLLCLLFKMSQYQLIEEVVSSDLTKKFLSKHSLSCKRSEMICFYKDFYEKPPLRPKKTLLTWSQTLAQQRKLLDSSGQPYCILGLQVVFEQYARKLAPKDTAFSLDALLSFVSELKLENVISVFKTRQPRLSRVDEFLCKLSGQSSEQKYYQKSIPEQVDHESRKFARRQSQTLEFVVDLQLRVFKLFKHLLSEMPKDDDAFCEAFFQYWTTAMGDKAARAVFRLEQSGLWGLRKNYWVFIERDRSEYIGLHIFGLIGLFHQDVFYEDFVLCMRHFLQREQFERFTFCMAFVRFLRKVGEWERHDLTELDQLDFERALVYYSRGEYHHCKLAIRALLFEDPTSFMKLVLLYKTYEKCPKKNSAARARGRLQEKDFRFLQMYLISTVTAVDSFFDVKFDQLKSLSETLKGQPYYNLSLCVMMLRKAFNTKLRVKHVENTWFLDAMGYLMQEYTIQGGENSVMGNFVVGTVFDRCRCVYKAELFYKRCLCLALRSESENKSIIELVKKKLDNMKRG